MQRKSQLEISSNWIFVLLVGGAILVFFIAVMNSQVGSHNQDTSNKIASRMDAIISVVQQNPGSVQVLSPLTSEMDFECDTSGDSYTHSYSVKGGSQRNYLETELIFTPPVIRDKSPIIAWTRTLSMPEPIGSLLYLSDKKTQYIFVDDSYSSTQEIYDTFPRNFSKKNMTVNELQGYTDQGYEKYIIVADSNLNIHNQNLKIASKASLVEIVRSQPYVATQAGNVMFYNKLPQASTTTKYPYVGLDMLYGAIISGDASLYKCSLKKILDMSIIANNLSIIRMEDIRANFSDGDACKGLFSDALAIDTFRKMNTNINTFEDAGLTGDLNTLIENMQDIDYYNTEMLTQDCPLIY